MAKPTGFMEFERELPTDRDPAKRVKDWDEFHNHMTVEALQSQGARCMDCGIPFCHTGTRLPENSPFASGCPINNLIPEWNDLAYRGLWHEALERLHKTNNFPEFTGRVCPAPCEGSCVLGINEEPVTIKNIEVSLVDRGWNEGWVTPQLPDKRTGKTVAVVGSGPAGLCCAMQLNRAGHRVTVYERSDRAGGLLMYGIPNMKLDKSLVLRRVDQMEAEGVTFVTNTHIGKDIPAQQLIDEFDAVVLCIGALKPRDLPIHGCEFNGVYQAIDFLHANTKSLLDSRHADGNYISAKDKNVVVLGGGDTGTDCVATSIRHGCKSLFQFDIIPEPPRERAPSNPWPEWPKVYKLDYGQEEGAALFGRDPREWLLSTVKFLADGNGNLRGLVTKQVEWVQDNGRPFREVEGTEKEWPAELVLLSMGWLGPEETILDELDLERDPRSNALSEEGRYTTKVPGLFVAGDVRRGMSLVVWAFREGRGAAREVDRHLMGTTQLP
ncbi:MAG: glutamate synthase subunit beta [Candidatus Latescibacterota bacterium]|nr:glutamate synthase subunit beta [Candidatus Latescibacterota bacterium]